MTALNKVSVLKMNVNVINLERACCFILSKVGDKKSAYVCVSNVHMCMEVYDDNSFMEVVNSADLVVADGKPISLYQRISGFGDADQVRGEDLMHSLCAEASSRGLNIGLFGCDEITLIKVERELRRRHKGLKVVYQYAPPFRELCEDELAGIYLDIHNTRVDILFVALGCPKQEKWMSQAKMHVNVVSVGVGAAFDFIAGSKPSAPEVMKRLYLEWLFRLLCEPRRLFKRYIVQNVRFIYHCLVGLIFNAD